MPDEFIPCVVPPEPRTSNAWWFIYSGYKLFIYNSGDTDTIPVTEMPEKLGVDIARCLCFGTFQGRPCYAAEGTLQGEDCGQGQFRELRTLFERLEDGFFEMALTALHLIEWDKTYHFCSKCGGELKNRKDIRAKDCVKCGRSEFPRISPAIIVLIEKGETLLLARSPRFAHEFSSVLAGFVEPGESLEEAVHREVGEEVGITVKDVAYFGSQPWPFPDSLMIGFTAQYASGEIRVDGNHRSGLVSGGKPAEDTGKLSIARKLIDWFVEKHSQ